LLPSVRPLVPKFQPLSTPFILLAKYIVVGFEVFTAVVLKSSFFWDMTPGKEMMKNSKNSAGRE
jgi:hypothetical protein